MNLFNKLDKAIFLKECSELKNYILKLEELYEKSKGELKNKLERELKIAKLGEFGEMNNLKVYLDLEKLRLINMEMKLLKY